MIGLVLVTHGRLAAEFVTAMEHVVGPQEAIEAICIGPDDNMERRRKDIANADTFVAHIKAASGVFFEGGRQWKLADAYLGTKVQTELNNLLARGGVIGGSSAGATILGDLMVRGDTKTNTIMIGDHTQSLGFVKNVAVDQHVLVRGDAQVDQCAGSR